MKIATDNKRAFTLVEMILAIGVAALVLIAVNAVLFTALHLREVTTDYVDAAAPVDTAVTLMRRDLQCLVMPTNITGSILSGSFRVGSVNSQGIGDPVAAEIYTATGALGANAPWSEIQRVTYGLRNSTDGSGRRSLVRTVTRNLLASTTQDVSEQLMLAGVESVTFSGYNGSQWLNVWDTSDPYTVNTNLPLAVRVEIQMAGGNINARPEPIQLVVPVDVQPRTNTVLASTSSTGG